MSRTDIWVRPGRSGPMVWGYDGDKYDPSRRVSLSPWAMLGDCLRTDLEARGILLTIFCRYWSKDRAVPEEHVRLEHRLTPRKFRRLLDELIEDGLVIRRSGELYPAKSFGPAPRAEAGLEPRAASRRDMPSDWLELREEVFVRDGYACVYCGSGRDLHCDHVHPVALGGGHNPSNLVTACATCNLSKGSKTVEQWRPDVFIAMRRLAGDE